MIKGYNPRHSEYQIINFIIKPNGRTIYGQYRQCIREIIARISNKNMDGATKKEALIFYDIYLQLKDQIDFDNMEILEAQYWTETIKYKIALEVWVNGRPSLGTIEAALNMPNRDEMINFISSSAQPRVAKMFIESAKPLEFKPSGKLIEMGDVYNEFKGIEDQDGGFLDDNQPICIGE